jgi:uncharacterized RDD family membrane protein YckC
MRCPKCHYISFGSGDRCRNCGYEFSLAPEAQPVDLPIQNRNEAVGPLGDFALTERALTSGSTPSSTEDEGGPTARRSAAPSRLDLPLFTDRGHADDAPLVSPSAVPRQPLSVRRGPPATARALQDRLVPRDDTVPDSNSHAVGDLRAVNVDLSGDSELHNLADEAEALRSAPVFLRLLAGVIDVLILASIDGAILYFTLRLLSLSFGDLPLLPPVPLAVFLLLLNGGYLATFTAAGGQTIGKMMTGIKVVTQPPEGSSGGGSLRVTLGASVLRATAYIASLLPAGLGFLPILFAEDGRALHDRLANTRVVKS